MFLMLLMKLFFSIPWRHQMYILDKIKDVKEALFYVHKTIENGWSRNMLLNMLDTRLYEVQGKAITNFDRLLPVPQSDLAQETLKDPYNFDFLTMREGYVEKELEDALTENITKFLLELGNGFAYVGRQVRIVVGQKELFMDLLFYNIKLHSYVVIELKTGEFKAEYVSKLGLYVTAVNHQMKHQMDNNTIGLLICKTETQSQMRPSLGNKVGHISLSFSPKDKERLTDKYMTDTANEYLKGMGIIDTQYLIVRHNDREHPHCHIVYNRVNNFGQTIKDSNNFRRNIEVCRDITLSRKLYMPQGKENVKIERLREPYRTKFEIWQTIKQILNNIRSWEELRSYLHNQNIEISFKYKGTTKEIQGIIFLKGKYSFKGSAIDRSFSYAKIDRQIKRNISPKQQETLEQTLQKPCSDQSKSLNDIIFSNITNRLNLLGIPTSNTTLEC